MPATLVKADPLPDTIDGCDRLVYRYWCERMEWTDAERWRMRFAYWAKVDRVLDRRAKLSRPSQPGR